MASVAIRADGGVLVTPRQQHRMDAIERLIVIAGMTARAAGREINGQVARGLAGERLVRILIHADVAADAAITIRPMLAVDRSAVLIFIDGDGDELSGLQAQLQEGAGMAA